MSINNNLQKYNESTEFDVKLNEMSRLARYYDTDRNSRIQKIFSTILTGFSLASKNIQGLLGLSVGTILVGVAVVIAMPVIAKVTAFVIASFAFGYGIYRLAVTISTFTDNLTELRLEKKLIEALGGKEVFKKLPVLPTEKVKIGPTDYLDSTTPNDVEFQPITKGVDRFNRPFVTFCFTRPRRNDLKGKILTMTLFKRYSESDCRTWVIGGDRVGGIMGTLSHRDLKEINMLVNGTHDEAQLVEAKPIFSDASS